MHPPDSFPLCHPPSACPRAAAVLLCLLAACDQARAPTTAHPPAAGDLKAALAPGARAALTATGEFPPHAPAAEARPQLTAEDAARVALAKVQTFGANLLPQWEKAHGSPIDLPSLRPQARVYYGTSAFNTLPAGADASAAREYGPYYFVTLVDPRGRPVLSTAIPAFSTNLRVETSGRLDLGGNRSGLFTTGIPASFGASLPMPPEDAVRIAARATGALATGAPDLVLPGPGFAPQWARWRIRLDRQVVMEEAGTRTRRREATVFVGPRGRLYAERAAQPASAEVLVTLRPASRLRLARRYGMPVDFVEVRPVGEGGGDAQR